MQKFNYIAYTLSTIRRQRCCLSSVTVSHVTYAFTRRLCRTTNSDSEKNHHSRKFCATW